MNKSRSYLTVRQHGTNQTELIPNLVTADDRCDRCGVEARSVVILHVAEPPNVLLFCGHHTNLYEAALISKGATIYRKEGFK